jgi:hypothetical protein
MRNISQSKLVSILALLFGVFVTGILAVGVSEARTVVFPNMDIVLLDCVEDANAFVVQNISTTRNVGIHQGLGCAEAIRKLFASGFVLRTPAGGVTAVDPASLNHFLMLFVLDIDAFIEPVKKQEPVPLVPVPKIHEPLSPIIQRR